MGTVKVYDGVVGRKLREAAIIAGTTQGEVLGCLVVLWQWAMDNADANGIVKHSGRKDVIRCVSAVSDDLFTEVADALFQAGFVEERDGCLIFDEWKGQQAWHYKEEAARKRDTERKRTERLKAKAASPEPIKELEPLKEPPNEEKPPEPPAEPKKKKASKKHYAEFVLLTKDEYAKLCAQYGEPLVKAAIDILNQYITEILTIADCERNGFLIGDILAIYDAKTKTCEHVAYYMGGIGGYEAVHSSATVGCLCGTKVRNGFTHVLRHRYIKGAALENAKEETEMPALYMKQVQLDSGHLNLRNGPSAEHRDIGDVPDGAIVEVLVEGDWPFIRYNGKTGYVSGKYLYDLPEEEILIEDEPEDYTRWGVFIPCENQERAEMLVRFFNVGVVCQREVIE